MAADLNGVPRRTGYIMARHDRGVNFIVEASS